MPNLAITASGMVTALGFNSRSSCAAMRAGIRGVTQSYLWDDESGEYLGAGKVHLPHWWHNISKLADLVTPAIQECLEAAAPTLGSKIPILLGISNRLDDSNVVEIINEIQVRLGFQLHPASELIVRDHISVAIGLQKSKEILSQGHARYCIVAGVDSLIDQDLAERFLSQRRLLTPINSNGFVSGEAGSAVLVCESDIQVNELEILGIGISREDSLIESEAPLRGEGLIRALAQAFQEAGLALDDLHYRITDLNGEHYRFKEMAFAMMRCERKPKPKLFELWHPIEYVGDIGAAIGPILLGVALHASRMEYGVGPKILLTCANDDGERMAIVARFCTGENQL